MLVTSIRSIGFGLFCGNSARSSCNLPRLTLYNPGPAVDFYYNQLLPARKQVLHEYKTIEGSCVASIPRHFRSSDRPDSSIFTTMKLPILYLASLAPLVAAHFELKYPTSRDGSEEEMTQFPCGGAAQSSNRTQVSISAGSFPVALSMGHSQTAVEVLLALGSDPGTNYNITLHQTFEIQGLGAFCLPHIKFDESILGTNITDGMNATVQVQSNGDPTGGLYAVCCPVDYSV